MLQADISVKTWLNLPFSNPNQISTISMHKPSLVKIRFLLKLSSVNKNMDMSQADNFAKNWRNLPISNPKAELHNINAYTKFGKTPLIFTEIIWKWKYECVVGR